MAKFVLDMRVHVEDDHGRKTGVKFQMCPITFASAEYLAQFFEGAVGDGRYWYMATWAKDVRAASQLVESAVAAARITGKNPASHFGMLSATIPLLGHAAQAQWNHKVEAAHPTAPAAARQKPLGQK